MSNATLVNFVGGETSPKSRGRFDIPSYNSSLRKLLNFIPEVEGPARFRSGFAHVADTRGGALARLIPFQANNSKAFMLEFTDKKMRVYKDEVIVTLPRTTITAITQANPAVITVASTTDLVDDDEVIITALVGMIELNGRQVKLANKSGSTYELVDPTTGANIDSTGFGAYVSGGTLAEIFELDTPYLAGELNDIHVAQNRDEMFLTHFNHEPRFLTVDAAENWQIQVQVRVNDPFITPFSTLTITAIVLGTQTKVTFASTPSASRTVLYTLSGIVGTTQLNGGIFFLDFIVGSPTGPQSAFLKNPDQTDVDSTSFTAYVSDGIATPNPENPIAVAFYEGRLGYFGTNQRPSTFFLSRSPNSVGANRYNDFTGGTNADDAVFFTLAPITGQVDFIAWAIATSKRLLVGTFGGPFRISGGGFDEPITPSSINVRQIDAFGCEAVVPTYQDRAFYIQRGGTTLRSILFDDAIDDFASRDMLVNADQIATSPLRRVIAQAGRPNIVWTLRADGILAAVTVEGAQDITGWQRHKLGGTDAKIIDVSVLPRTDRNDRLWVVTERTIEGVTRHSVEILVDEVRFPDLEDFFTTADAEAADLERFENALYRIQERYVHMDGAATFNGSTRGLNAGATLTPGALTGNTIAFTASVAVFTQADVGNEIWKKPDADTGIGSGRAIITAVNGPGTIATCDIFVAFDSLGVVAAGEWHIAAKVITNLWHLEGEKVAVLIDGAVLSDGRGTNEFPILTVADGKITLVDAAAVVHVGEFYDGILVTHNLELGGRSGPAQAKPRNIVEIFMRFLWSLGVDYGTDLHRMEKIAQRDNLVKTSRPAPVFSGIRKLPYSDIWSAEGEKHIVVSQRLPLPCIVQFIDIWFETGDER